MAVHYVYSFHIPKLCFKLRALNKWSYMNCYLSISFGIWIIILFGIWLSILFYTIVYCADSRGLQWLSSQARHGLPGKRRPRRYNSLHTMRVSTHWNSPCPHCSHAPMCQPEHPILPQLKSKVPSLSGSRRPLQYLSRVLLALVTLPSASTLLSFYPTSTLHPGEKEWQSPLLMLKDSHQGTLSSSSPSPCGMMESLR